MGENAISSHRLVVAGQVHSEMIRLMRLRMALVRVLGTQWFRKSLSGWTRKRGGMGMRKNTWNM